MSKKILKGLIGGNWKCNGSIESLKSFSNALKAGQPFSPNSEVVLALPSIYLNPAKSLLPSEVHISAQDCGFKTGYGAFTGEISADMLAENGIHWTLTGHSERRVGFGFSGEPDNVVGIKTKNALDKGLSVIACIGEHLEQRKNGTTMEVCARQLNGIQASLKGEEDWKKVVIAYEPVWAIGTGMTATPAQAQETHAQIREWLSKNVSPSVAAQTRILYGGSVSASNCDELYGQEDINGFLVGGASLKAADFLKIINSTQNK